MSKIYKIGLGAGMVKHANEIDERALDTISVVELGSFTLDESKGNDDPVSYWDEETQSGLNSIGLKNVGIRAFFEHEAPKIARLFVAKQAVIDLSLAPKEPGDLAKMIEVVRTYSAVLPIRYLIYNGACPNKWKNGEQQPVTAHDPEATRALLLEARDAPFPAHLKIAPDTPQPTLVKLVDICHDLGIVGIDSGNTRNVEAKVNGTQVLSMPRGGLSGKPLLESAIAQVAALRQIIDGKGIEMHLTGMGGVLNPEDAIRMFEAGADDVRVASLFYFGGGWKAVTKLATAVNLS